MKVNVAAVTARLAGFACRGGCKRQLAVLGAATLVCAGHLAWLYALAAGGVTGRVVAWLVQCMYRGRL